MKRFSKHEGFTLIELLVVIAVMGVATTLGATMLTKISDGWRRVSIRAELDAMADLVFERMAKDFADVLSAHVSGVTLVGITQTLQDDARYPGQTVPDDMIIIPVRTSTGPKRPQAGATIMYRVDREGDPEKPDKEDLLVQTVGDLLTDIPIGGRVEMIPDASVVSLCIEYASKTGAWTRPSDSEGWFERNLPRAVRVSLVLADREFPYEQVTRSKVFPIHVD